MAGKSDGKMIFENYETDGIHLPPLVTEPDSQRGGFEGSDLFAEDYSNHPKEKKTNNELRQRKNAKKNDEEDQDAFKNTKSMTVDTKNPVKRNKNVIAFSSLMEMIIYYSFMIILTIVGVTLITRDNQVMSYQMNEYFVTGEYLNATNGTSAYQEMNELYDIWNYIENQLLVGIYLNETVVNEAESISLGMQNIYIGKLRLRMIRVNNKTCDIHDYFDDQLKECKLPYSKSLIDKSPFGPANLSAFIYAEGSEINSPDFTNNLHKTYSGGGFVQDIPIDNREKAYEIIETLKENEWLDEYTRFVFIDFTVYNQDLKVLVSTKIYIEVSLELLVFPKKNVKAVKLYRYISNDDLLDLGYEAIFRAFIIFYVAQAGFGIFKNRFSYFVEVGNIFDFIVVLVSIYYVAVTLNFLFLVHNKAEEFLGTETYVDNSTFYNVFALRGNIFITLTILCWMKLFKFFALTKTLAQTLDTFIRSVWDIITISIIFIVAIIAFSGMTYIRYVGDCIDYNTFLEGFMAFNKITIGEFDYSCMVRNNTRFTPTLVICYTFILFYLLINFYLAVLTDTFAKIVLEDFDDRFVFADFLKQCYKRISGILGIVKMPKEHLSAKNLCEWRKMLQESGYNSFDIYVSFLKFNIKKQKDCNFENQRAVKKFLDNRQFLNPFYSGKNNTQLKLQFHDHSFDSSKEKITNYVFKLDQAPKSY